jgi:2-phospho-L-lactate guanylyltransferase
VRGPWVLVLPLKPLSAAKSRLRGAVPGVGHGDLVLAIARDTVRAALACPAVSRVLVVTADRVVAEAVTALGAEHIPDTPDRGLNAALRHGARAARSTVGPAVDPGTAGPGVAGPRAAETGPVAALTADLPALRPAELADALTAAAELPGRGYVPDAAGTGTVLLTAPAGVPLSPAFGIDSATAHARSGATALAGPWPGLRRDVDTAADLAAAAALGLGRSTAALIGPQVSGRVR